MAEASCIIDAEGSVLLGRDPDAPWNESSQPLQALNTLRLAAADGQTTITVTVLYPTKDAREAALKTGMKEGMSQSFDRLDAYLRTIV